MIGKTNSVNITTNGSGDIKIIELNEGLSQATITQEQLDIMFPKDEKGNIYKPDYYIVISDTYQSSASHGFAYLGFWNPTSIRFNRLGTNGYYTWTLAPGDTKFKQERTKIIDELYQHNLYVKANNFYIFLTIIHLNSIEITSINNVNNFMWGKYLSCTGYLTSPETPITGLKYNLNDNKYYISTKDGTDAYSFEQSEVVSVSDNVVNLFGS